MSFATLEEAWGMPSLTQQAEPGAGFGSARGLTQGPPQQQKQAAARRRRRRTAAGAGQQSPHAGVYAPVPQMMPQREDDDTEVQNSRRFLARTYARFGLPGVLRLLPREAAAQMGSLAGGKGAGSKVWDSIVEFVTCPEKMLFMLLCAFAILVVWDTWHTPSGGVEYTPASLASLTNMQPFPVMMGASGISG